MLVILLISERQITQSLRVFNIYNMECRQFVRSSLRLAACSYNKSEYIANALFNKTWIYHVS